MPDFKQKYDLYVIPELNVTLKRFYVGDSPDELGTIAFWKQEIMDMFQNMPVKEIFNGIIIEIWDMQSPDLISTRNATLLDYDLHSPGNQTAVGLYFGGKRIAMGVFKHSLQSMSNIEYTRKALNHEFGHLIGDMINFDDGTNFIEQEVTRHIKANWYPQTSNAHENFAEHYRALLGSPRVVGYFSDDKPIPANPTLKTIFKTSVWLTSRLGKKAVSGVKYYDTWMEWTEHSVSFFWVVNKRYALTQNCEQFVWENNKWNQI